MRSQEVLGGPRPWPQEVLGGPGEKSFGSALDAEVRRVNRLQWL